jgi:hypothetical protein
MVDFWRIQVPSFGQPGQTDRHAEDASGLLVIASCPDLGIGEFGAHDWITPAGCLCERFQAGDRVRVKNDFFAGHVRMPGYIRGKPGVVVSESPVYPFPDAHAHGVKAVDEPTYDVAFRTEDLWPNSADPAFQSYLERIG